MDERVLDKLKILAESAKYDVSCASSGTSRSHKKGQIGSAEGWGICHSFAEDGRCISLLKIMLTNNCIYDCAYCINRRSNDLPRATLSVTELVNLTIEFYRRNYIEGLFLSSGVVRNPDYTMERLVKVVKDLRQVYRFNGYIHLKSIPGASQELVNEAGLYADRMSVNIEIPNEQSLQLLAPEKDFQSVFTPMLILKSPHKALCPLISLARYLFNCTKGSTSSLSWQDIILMLNNDNNMIFINIFIIINLTRVITSCFQYPSERTIFPMIGLILNQVTSSQG